MAGIYFPRMQKSAILDATKKYRYVLGRQWGEDPKNMVNFVLLNPSIADDKVDDPTVKACVEFARRWGFDALVMTNLFAYRATDPRDMRSCEVPQGPNNDAYIEHVAKSAKRVIAAWGTHGTHCGRDQEVLKILRGVSKVYCLDVTKSGQPKHPLYIKRSTEPKIF